MFVISVVHTSSYQQIARVQALKMYIVPFFRSAMSVFAIHFSQSIQLFGNFCGEKWKLRQSGTNWSPSRPIEWLIIGLR